MNLQRFLPSAVLQPFVKEFLIIESDTGIDSTVIPDTTLVLSFRYKGHVLRTTGEIKDNLPASVISGLRRSARSFYYTGGTSNLLVVFKEGGITAFSDIPAHEMFDRSISSDNLFLPADIREILERLAAAASDPGRIDIVEAFLQRKLDGDPPDPLIDQAVRLIRQQKGIVRIKDLASSLYISQDPLEKRFRTLVGSTPKQFASIVRLRNLIKKYPSYTSLTQASYDAGYFDQSHFIKDFRQFTGQSPKDFFQSARYW